MVPFFTCYYLIIAALSILKALKSFYTSDDFKITTGTATGILKVWLFKKNRSRIVRKKTTPERGEPLVFSPSSQA